MKHVKTSMPSRPLSYLWTAFQRKGSLSRLSKIKKTAVALHELVMIKNK